MKFYVAARWGLREEVRDIYKKIEEGGHEITEDWTVREGVRPYSQHPKLSREYSISDVEGVRDCDVFVLLSDKAGTGIHTELGTAILSNIERDKPKIYVIGDHLDMSMFFFHSSVNRSRNIDAVLE